MDGNNGSNFGNEQFGSCQPSSPFCTHDDEFNYVTKKHFMECDYQGVENAVSHKKNKSSIEEVKITKKLAKKLLKSDQI